MFMGSLRAFWLNVNVFMIFCEAISLLQNPTMPLKTAFGLQVAQWKMCLSRALGDGEQSSLPAGRRVVRLCEMGRAPGWRLPRSHPGEVSAHRCKLNTVKRQKAVGTLSSSTGICCRPSAREGHHRGVGWIPSAPGLLWFGFTRGRSRHWKEQP